MFIKLTRIIKGELLPESLERFEEFQKNFTEEVLESRKDENGRDADWYEDLGLPVPEELLKANEEQEITYFFKEEDYEYQEYTWEGDTKRIEYVEDGDIGSYVGLYSGMTIQVKETREEIIKLIQENE